MSALAAFAGAFGLGAAVVALTTAYLVSRVFATGFTVLDARLGEIAAAIRERGPDLHVQLRDVPPNAAAHALAARLRLEADRMGDVEHPQGWAAGDDQTVALLREAAEWLEGRP